MYIPISKPIIGKTEKRLVKEVLDSGILSQGPMVEKFEEEFAMLFEGNQNAIAVNSGTAALHTALHIIGIKEGDEVITTPFTFVATANAIRMCGAKPVFVDISEDTFNIDPIEIEQKITDRTRAIVSVDLYGQLCNYLPIIELKQKHKNIEIIEDAAQAMGATMKGINAGEFGLLGTFSFYATKNITTGEGGMIFTLQDTLAKKARKFINHGQSKQYEYEDIGYNYRMSELQAVIGLGQLEHLEEFTNKRIANAKRLTEGLYDIGGITVPYIMPNAKHVFHQYTIKVGDLRLNRDELQEYLKTKGIETRAYYPKPLHLQPAFAYLGYKEGDFPIAERLSKQVLSLPVHPSIRKKEIDYIIKTIRSI